MPTSTDQPIPRDVWRLAAVIVFGAFMSGLDASVVNVGLDSLARDLNADLGAAQWVTNGYLLALAVSLPVCGWLGRRVGVGRLWLTALAAFTISSGLCALAASVEALIALRVLQGLSAGLLIPAGQTLLGQAVGPGRLGRVMAVLGIAVTAAPAIGPVVGGVIVDGASWPWLFLINLPIGAAGLLLGWRYVPRGAAQRIGRLDVAGLALLTAGLPLLVYGLTVLGERRTATDPAVVVPVIAGVAALAAYGLRARTVPCPVLDLRLFANRAYSAATATAAFTGASMFGAGLLYPLYFQIGRGEDPTTTGLLLISLSVGTIAMLPVSGRLVDRSGGGPISFLGGLAAIATTVPFAVLPTDVDGVLVQALLVLRGAAIAVAIVPAGTAAYKAVTAEQLPDATTQVNIAQRLGGALGGALFAVVLAAGLPTGIQGAFHASFWVLSAASALGVGAAAWLTYAERRGRPVAHALGSPRLHPAANT